jgi:hypothetical protein
MQGLERDRAKRSKTVDEFVGGVTTAIRSEGEKKGGGLLSGLFRRKPS